MGEKKRTRMRVKHRVGAATLLQDHKPNQHHISNTSRRKEERRINNGKGRTEKKVNEPYPHTGKTGHAHHRQQNCSRFRACKTEHSRDKYSVNIGFAEGRRNGETTDEEHDRRGKHHAEYIPIQGRK